LFTSRTPVATTAKNVNFSKFDIKLKVCDDYYSVGRHIYKHWVCMISLFNVVPI